MNGDNQPQQEQHQLAERVAIVESAIKYQDQATSTLREEMRAGFARIEAQMSQGFSRVDGEFVRLRTDMKDGFARSDAESIRLRTEMRGEMHENFKRLDEQIMKARTTDFRILLGICTTMALGIFGLVIKVFALI